MQQTGLQLTIRPMSCTINIGMWTCHSGSLTVSRPTQTRYTIHHIKLQKSLNEAIYVAMYTTRRHS